jgi:hypothetical protein
MLRTPLCDLLGIDVPAILALFGPWEQVELAAISFHMGVPADLIQQAHDKGITWLQTVGEAEAAEQAVAAGADVLIAQGGEAAGNAGWISTMVLVPAVADVAGDVPTGTWRSQRTPGGLAWLCPVEDPADKSPGNVWIDLIPVDD